MSTQPSPFDRLTNWLSQSVTLKLALIAFLALLLLWPSSQVNSLVYERRSLSEGARDEISGKWGNPQEIGGIFIRVPYTVTVINPKTKLPEYEDRALFLLPKQLTIKSEVEPQTRYRGIYSAILYSSTFRLSGNFDTSLITTGGMANSKLQWDKATLSMAIGDMRGIKKDIQLLWNGQPILFHPGVPQQSPVSTGVTANLPLATSGKSTFDIQLSLNGSLNIDFIPTGEETKVSVHSNWPSPSFTGQFLPQTRHIDDKGFSADWTVLQFNRNYPQVFTSESEVQFSDATFGVSFFQPVDNYSMTERATKYAIMFIFLTFLLFFFAEVIQKKSVHPFQYFLVGMALVIFYLLLLSLSEHIPFNQAYLIAAIATVLLNALFAGSIMRSWKLGSLVGSLLSLLYGFLYVLLKSEDFSLLIGSVGLFIILAVVMYFTRNINFFNISNNNPTPPQ